jgi:hypothetical protein
MYLSLHVSFPVGRQSQCPANTSTFAWQYFQGKCYGLQNNQTYFNAIAGCASQGASLTVFNGTNPGQTPADMMKILLPNFGLKGQYWFWLGALNVGRVTGESGVNSSVIPFFYFDGTELNQNFLANLTTPIYTTTSSSNSGGLIGGLIGGLVDGLVNGGQTTQTWQQSTLAVLQTAACSWINKTNVANSKPILEADATTPSCLSTAAATVCRKFKSA